MNAEPVTVPAVSPPESGSRRRLWLILGSVLLSAGAALVALRLGGFFERQPPQGPSVPQLGEALVEYARAHGWLMVPRYREVAAYSTGLAEVCGVAIDPMTTSRRSLTADRLYVAGDSAVKVFDAEGRLLREWKTAGPARAVAVGGSGAVYVATLTAVEKYDAAGTLLARWGEEGQGPGQMRHVTSLAVAEPDVYVADAGNRCVHRFAADGDFVQDIGRRDPEAGVPGLVVPSPYLDCAADSAGILHVTDPGRLRVERYSPDGRLLGWWGKSGWSVADFPGCCNPAHIAVTRDGRVVTSEKGIRRVKVYDRAGHLAALVEADPDEGEWPEDTVEGRATFSPGRDVAVDSRGRVYVSEPTRGTVRVFEPK